MTMGLIAVLGNSSSVTYTATANCKVVVVHAGNSAGAATNLNGSILVTSLTSVTTVVSFYMVAGQSALLATGASSTCVISSIEE